MGPKTALQFKFFESLKLKFLNKYLLYPNGIQNLKVDLNLEGSSFKSQMKKADKSGAKIALIIGDQEVEKKIIQVKLIRDSGLQESIEVDKLCSYIKDKINFG